MWLCKLFGHKTVKSTLDYTYRSVNCYRCGERVHYSL